MKPPVAPWIAPSVAIGAEGILVLSLWGTVGQLRGTCDQGRSLSARTSPGSPRTRSPRMLRWISDVPPSIELARDRRNILRDEPGGPDQAEVLGAAHRVVVADQAVGAEQVDAQLVDALVDLGEHQLGDRALGPGVAGLAVLAGADVGEPQDLGLDPQLGQPVAVDRVLVACLLLPDAHRLGDGAASPGRAAPPPPPMVRALVHQGGHRHPPALADVADAVGVGDPHVGEVHLVELGLAGDLAQRPHLDARARACRGRSR